MFNVLIKNMSEIMTFLVVLSCNLIDLSFHFSHWVFKRFEYNILSLPGEPESIFKGIMNFHDLSIWILCKNNLELTCPNSFLSAAGN